MDSIKNKVAESGIITLDPSQLISEKNIMGFDLKPFLFEELVLREKEFRQKLKEHDWNRYAGKDVAVYCSTDAIIPTWAYMLVVSALQPVARSVMAANPPEHRQWLIHEAIRELNPETYRNQRIVIKGCSDVPLSVYAELIMKLQPVVRSIMYGEPCSTVPVFKSSKTE